jgi:hypothetical protein
VSLNVVLSLSLCLSVSLPLCLSLGLYGCLHDPGSLICSLYEQGLDTRSCLPSNLVSVLSPCFRLSSFVLCFVNNLNLHLAPPQRTHAAQHTEEKNIALRPPCTEDGFRHRYREFGGVVSRERGHRMFVHFVRALHSLRSPAFQVHEGMCNTHRSRERERERESGRWCCGGFCILARCPSPSRSLIRHSRTLDSGWSASR